MEAKDTVILEAQNKRGKYYYQYGNLFEAKVIVVGSLNELLQTQAEISFKAGYEEGKEYMAGEINHSHNLSKRAERERIIKLAIENDILCTEQDAKDNGCETCKAFWKALGDK